MPKAKLDDEEAQNTAVSSVERGGNYADAAKAVGISRQALHNYMDTHPEFRSRIEAARFRAKEMAGRLPAVMRDPRVTGRKPASPKEVEQSGAAEALGVSVEMVQDVDRLPGLSAFDLILEVERIALDPDHRASARALDIICELKLGKMVRAQKRREEREADRVAASESVSQGDQAAIIELPVNETEAPGRAPVPMARAGLVVDAEVVDRG